MKLTLLLIVLGVIYSSTPVQEKLERVRQELTYDLNVLQHPVFSFEVRP